MDKRGSVVKGIIIGCMLSLAFWAIAIWIAIKGCGG